MRRMAETTEVKVICDAININEDADTENTQEESLSIPEGVEVYEINGPYFFGAGNKFEEVMNAFSDKPKVRIIRMRKVPFIDSTGIHNLTNLCIMSEKNGIKIVLSGVTERVHETLTTAHFQQIVSEENICSHIDFALERAKQLV